MNRKTVIQLIFLLLIGQCSPIHSQVLQSINLTKLPDEKKISLSNLGFSEINYIPLETNEFSLISNIDLVWFNEYSINKIIPGDGYFLIKNKNKVLKFGEDGKFIANIGKVGRGPGEINQIEDLDIDHTDQSVYMVSGWQKKFYQYSSSGKFIRTFNVPFYVREFRIVDDKILCYCGNNRGSNEHSFALIDKAGHVIKFFPNKYPFKSKSSFGFTHENLFYSYNNKVNIKEIYSDTIFSFEKTMFKPHAVIKVGNKQVTPKVRSELTMEDIGANIIEPMNLLQFGDFLYYSFIYKFVPPDVKILSFISSKKNDKQALFDVGEGIINDLDGGSGIIPLTTLDDRTIVTLIDAFTLKKHITSESFKNSKPLYPQKKKDLENLANKIKETDNPVLIIVKLK